MTLSCVIVVLQFPVGAAAVTSHELDKSSCVTVSLDATSMTSSGVTSSGVMTSSGSGLWLRFVRRTKNEKDSNVKVSLLGKYIRVNINDLNLCGKAVYNLLNVLFWIITPVIMNIKSTTKCDVPHVVNSSKYNFL